ncbi:uncharacterized protein LOC133821981 [Humulus lupulus]|uniref:uncharacterized protein LOC133821981 n=1 Tax=Humulus lupulus TaxID=3486 RepID=UPI002B40B110|nr:uncharacterized protein LOC133821981 [Humulus lupulus]
MDENHVAFDSIPMEDQEIAINAQTNNHISSSSSTTTTRSDHGWEKVVPRRQRKTKPSAASDSHATNSNKLAVSNGSIPGADNVFRSLEKNSEDRRRRILEAQMLANVADVTAPVRSKTHSDDADAYDSDEDDSAENAKVEESKKVVKPKKPKKPKVTVAEAAAKIDPDQLSAFLVEISASYESQQDIKLIRFADYFGRAFSSVSSAQFPWVKLFRESTVAKIADIPLNHISDVVYKTSVDFINQHSLEALGSFVLWSLDSLLADFASQQAGAKGSKKAAQHVSSKSQVAIFVVVAMVLRRKPDVLISLLPTLRENSKYQGQDKLPLIVWIILQACQGDLAVGLYGWSRNLLPLVSGKSSNPQSRDLVLQLAERILASPKARTILVNGAVRKGERLIPPSAFEILVRATFPTSSARVKATERFEAVYPTLKEVALAGSPGSKAMKQVAQQILNFAIIAAGESTPELANEASGIFIWCLTQTAECYKQWDKAYQENLKASVAVLKKLSDQWKQVSVKLFPLVALRETLKNFKNQNEKALASGADGAEQALFKEANKYCKQLLGKVSSGNGCVKSMVIVVLLVAVGAAVMSPDMESWDLKKLSLVFNNFLSH